MSKNEVHPINITLPCSPNDIIYVIPIKETADEKGKPLYIVPDRVEELKIVAADTASGPCNLIVVRVANCWGDFSWDTTAFATAEAAAEGYDRLMKIYEFNTAPQVEYIPLPADEQKKKGKKKK